MARSLLMSARVVYVRTKKPKVGTEFVKDFKRTSGKGTRQHFRFIELGGRELGNISGYLWVS